MNIEFHYYILHIICNKAGFSENDAYIMSYSSQYVDNNIVSNIIKLNNQEYETIVTQNYGWWGDWFPKNVYIPFHFFPGDNQNKSLRKDNKTNQFNVTYNSSNVNQLLDKAFESDNLYRIGIALHTYADTWAHQNFSGLNESWNIVNGETLMPNVGHAEVWSKPDKLTGKWTDDRLKDEFKYVDNRKRFLDAAKNIYILLCKYNGQNYDDAEQVVEYINELIGPDDESSIKVKERIYDYILEEDLMEYNKYEWIQEALNYNRGDYFSSQEIDEMDTIEWIKDALLYKTSIKKKPVLIPKENFYDSNYYLWNEAAKEHLNCAREILKELL